MSRSGGTKKQINENLRLKGILTKQNQELVQMHERLAQMGFVLTFLVLTATEPVEIPMAWTSPTNFKGLDMTPDIENEVLHITPRYFPFEDEVEAEIVAAENEGMPS